MHNTSKITCLWALLIASGTLYMPCYAAMYSEAAIYMDPTIAVVRDPGTTPESLTKYLATLTFAERSNAVNILGTATDYSIVTVPPLIALLEDRSEQVRAEAASALVRLGEPAIAPLLLSLASKDVTVDQYKRIGMHQQTVPMRSDYIAWILINTHAAVEQPMVDFLRNELASRGQTESEKSENNEDVLAVSLSLFDFILRERSVLSLPTAIALLDDNDPNLRNLGRSILASLGDAGYDALPTLERAISRADEVDQTVYVLARIGGDAQILLRKWLVQHPNPNVRVATAQRINGDSDGIAALVRAVERDSENQVKEKALFRLSTFDRLPEAALKPIIKCIETTELRQAALQALKNVDATDSAWKDVTPPLINLLDGLPVVEENYIALDSLLVEIFTKSKSDNARIYDAVIQRIEKKVAAERSWDTFGLILAAIAVRPPDKAVPIELLDKILEGVSLSRVRDFFPLLARMYPKQIATARMQEQLKSGLERKFSREIKDNEDQNVELSDYYDILHYEDAIAITIEVLATDPNLTETISSYFEEVQLKPKLKETACSALKWSTEPDKDASIGKPWQAQLLPIWEKDCRPIASPRHNMQELIPEIVSKVKKAEEQARRDETDGSWTADWVVTDQVLKAYLKDGLSESPSEGEILLSLNAQVELNRSRVLIEYIEKAATGDPALGVRVGQQLPKLSWDKIVRFIEYFEQPQLLGDKSGIALALLEQIASNKKDFEIWSLGHRDDVADLVVKLLEWAQPKKSELTVLLVELIRSPEAKVRYASMLYIGKRRDLTVSLSSSWIALLNDSSEEVSVAAASIVVNSGEMIQMWDAAATIAINYELRSNISRFLNEIADYVRPSNLMSAGGYSLPSFPWPPPRYANRAKFGQDIDLSLISGGAATLGSVHNGLLATLRRVDPNFESGLFSVPGGFAMLTKVEQTDKEGRPLTERWINHRKPPSSMSEYLVALFLSPPGYYRVIAFIFTDNSDFGSSDKNLPMFSEGGLVLPSEIADLPLSSRQGFVLVYAFERRDMGTPRPYTVLSAAVHLTRSGLLPDLQTR